MCAGMANEGFLRVEVEAAGAFCAVVSLGRLFVNRSEIWKI